MVRNHFKNLDAIIKYIVGKQPLVKIALVSITCVRNQASPVPVPSKEM